MALKSKWAHAQSQLVNLGKFDGQLWLIPDKAITQKKAILVMVSGQWYDD